jgi:hypothetical protein
MKLQRSTTSSKSWSSLYGSLFISFSSFHYKRISFGLVFHNICVVEASEHVNHHLIMNLEHQGIITEKRGEGNVGAADNDAKFLTSS